MRLALAALLASAPAAAAPLAVTAALHDTRVRFAIQLEVDSDGASFPSANVDVDLPPRGVVTAGTVTADGHAHPLALTPVDAAEAAFQALAEGHATEAPWAVLVSSPIGGTANLRIAAPGTHRVTVELAIEAATCFARDQRFVEVPASWKRVIEAAPPPRECAPHAGGASAWLAFPAPAPAHVGALASRLSVTAGDVAKVEVDLARELAEVPANLHTAIVIDGSRSVRPRERDEQRAIVAAYLRRTPHTLVQVIGYARAAAPLLPAWTATEAAATRVDHALEALRARNGSNVDVGVAAAGRWLARTGGTRRVLVFTDERTARRLRGEDGTAFAAALPAGTLVHVIALRDAAGPLQRDDNVMFGALAVATGGIGVAGGLARAPDATLLARPITLDDIALSGPGWTDLDLGDCGDQRLPAGASCTWFARGTPAAGPVTMTASLWHRPITRYVRPQSTRALALARELSASGGLDETLQRDVDEAARAVNTVWSLFAAWGGRGGYDGDAGLGHGSGTGSGHTSATIVDTIGSTSTTPTVDLAAQLARPLAACGPAHATLEIELTLDEIVDVHVEGATGALRTCLEDAVWSTLVTVPDAPPISRASITL